MSILTDYVFTFNKMITPYLLTAVYWTLAFVLLIIALQAPDIFPRFGLISRESGVLPISLSLTVFVIGLALLRILFEMMILAFKVYDVMLKIAENKPVTETPQTEPGKPTRLVDRDDVRFSADEA